MALKFVACPQKLVCRNYSPDHADPASVRLSRQLANPVTRAGG